MHIYPLLSRWDSPLDIPVNQLHRAQIRDTLAASQQGAKPYDFTATGR